MKTALAMHSDLVIGRTQLILNSEVRIAAPRAPPLVEASALSTASALSRPMQMRFLCTCSVTQRRGSAVPSPQKIRRMPRGWVDGAACKTVSTCWIVSVTPEALWCYAPYFEALLGIRSNKRTIFLNISRVTIGVDI